MSGEATKMEGQICRTQESPRRLLQLQSTGGPLGRYSYYTPYSRSVALSTAQYYLVCGSRDLAHHKKACTDSAG